MYAPTSADASAVLTWPITKSTRASRSHCGLLLHSNHLQFDVKADTVAILYKAIQGIFQFLVRDTWYHVTVPRLPFAFSGIFPNVKVYCRVTRVPLIILMISLAIKTEICFLSRSVVAGRLSLTFSRMIVMDAACPTILHSSLPRWLNNTTGKTVVN